MTILVFMPALSNPTGSSSFADNSNLHTDGPDPSYEHISH